MIKVKTNLTLFSHFFFLFFLLNLGCSFFPLFGNSEISSLNQVGESNFRLIMEPDEKITILAREIHSSEPLWEHIEKAMVVHISVCVESLRDRNRVIGEEFRVFSENQEYEIELINENNRTNEQGCLVWRERIEYDYYAPARYVPFLRVVRASSSGNYVGEQRLTVALNLWHNRDRSGDEDLFFRHTLNQTWTDEGLALHSSVSESGDVQSSSGDFPILSSLRVVNSDYQNPLIAEIQELSVQSLYRSISSGNRNDANEEMNTKSFGLEYHFYLKLKTQVMNLFGNIKDEVLETGKYKVTATLFAKSGNQCAKLTTSASKEVSFLDNSIWNQGEGDRMLSFPITMHWNLSMINLNQVILQLEVTAEDLVEGIQFMPFKNYYELGNTNNDIFNPSRRYPPFLPEGALPDCDNLPVQLQLTRPVTLLDIVNHSQPFEIVDNFMNVHEESASLRTLFFQGKICFSVGMNITSNFYHHILQSSFLLSEISRIHDQRYVWSPFNFTPVHLLNDSSTENYCIRFYDQFRYKYHLIGYDPLIIYRAKTDFTSYTPILFLALKDKHSLSPTFESLDIINRHTDINLSGNRSLHLIEEEKRLQSRDKLLVSGVDRFLRHLVLFKTDLRIKPKLVISDEDNNTEQSKELRVGVYHVKVTSLDRTQELLQGEDPRRIENISSSQSLVYVDGSGFIENMYPFLMKDAKLSHLRQNLFFQYRLMNEKKLLILYLFSHIYGILNSQEQDFFSIFLEGINEGISNQWGSAFLESYQTSSTHQEIEAFREVLNSTLSSSSCRNIQDLSQSDRTICVEKIKIISSLLEEISTTYQSTETNDLDSFFENYLFCESSFFIERNLCLTRNQWMGTIKSVIGLNVNPREVSSVQNFSATQNYQVIDDFTKTRRILDRYLDLSSLTSSLLESSHLSLGVNDEVINHIWNRVMGKEDEILSLVLKILHSSSTSLSRIYHSQDRGTHEVIRHIQELLSISQELDMESYTKLYLALYKEQELVSPIYWSPFVFSNRYSTTQFTPFYELSKLNEEIYSRRDETEISFDAFTFDADEALREWEHYKNFTDCQTYQFCERCQQEQGSTSPAATDSCSAACALFNRNRYEECNEDQKFSSDYMDYLLKKEERVSRYDALSMCYGMIKPLHFFNMKYVSLNREENHWLLDPFCKNLLLNELARIQLTDYDDLDVNIERVLKGEPSVQQISFLSQLQGCLDEDPSSQMRDKMYQCLKQRFSPSSEQSSSQIEAFLSELNSVSVSRSRTLSYLVYSFNSESSDLPDLEERVPYDYNLFSPSSYPIEEVINKTVTRENLKDLIKQFDVNNNWVRGEVRHVFLGLCKFLIENTSNNSQNDFEILYRDCIKGFNILMIPLSSPSYQTIRANSLIRDGAPYIIEKQYRIFDFQPISEEGFFGNLDSHQLRSVEHAQVFDPIFMNYNIHLNNQNHVVDLASESSASKRIYLTNTDRNYTSLSFRLEKTSQRLKLQKYEECLVFHKNPNYQLWRNSLETVQTESLDFFEEIERQFYFLIHETTSHPFEDPYLRTPQDTLLDIYTKKGGGLILCVLNTEGETKEITENYFYIESEYENEEAEILESTDETNRSFSLYLRGMDSFLYFGQFLIANYYLENILNRPENNDSEGMFSTLIRSLSWSYETFALTQHYFNSPGIYTEKSLDECAVVSQLDLVESPQSEAGNSCE